jgi:hypothetical protein
MPRRAANLSVLLYLLRTVEHHGGKRRVYDRPSACRRLGPCKGRVDAIGAGLSYTTLINRSPLVLSLRYYQEFNAENRWEGNSTLASATIKW